MRVKPRPWVLVLLGGVVLTAIHHLLPTASSAQSVWYDVQGAATIGVAVLGIRRNRPGEPASWYLLTIGVALLVAGDVLWTLYDLVLHVDPPVPSVADLLYLAGYPFLIAGLAKMSAGRVNRDRAAPLDALLVAAALALVAWVAVLGPTARDPSLSSVGRAVALAYPLMDLAVLAAAAKLVLAPGERNPTYWLLVASVLLLLMADTVFAVRSIDGTFVDGGFADGAWLLSYLALAAAANHPRMAAVSDRPATATPTSRRIAVLVAVVVTAAALLGLEYAKRRVTGGAAIAVAATLLFGWLLARIWALSRRADVGTRQLQAKEAELAAAFDTSAVPMAIVALGEDVMRANAAMAELLGYPLFELTTMSLHELEHPDDRTVAADVLSDFASGTRSTYRGEHRFLTKSGDTVWGLLSIGLVRDDRGAPGHFVFQIQDITARKHAERELTFTAMHDPMTGLANRALLLDRLDMALRGMERRRGQPALIYLDLDGFKDVNDRLGHSAGDVLLVGLGGILTACVRPGDTVARLGGDEFAILLPDVEDARVAMRVAERAVDAVAQPFRLEGQDVTMGASAGVALGSPTVTAEDVLRDADMAMYSAKAHGGGRIELFEPSLRERVIERIELQSALRGALERGEFDLRFQPIVDLSRRRIVGTEALLRWNHPVEGLVPPGRFIGIAEETGLIVPIGRWVMHEACRETRLIQESFPSQPPLWVQVNVSPIELRQRDLPRAVASVLDETGLDPSSLVLEVTEGALIVDPATAAQILGQIRELGVRVAIDDFGSGYASLNYLSELPVDVLKIDKAFVDKVTAQDGSALVRTILDLGQNLGLATIAEGIEEDDQLEALRALGCGLGQGYLLSVPLERSGLREVLRHDREPAPAPVDQPTTRSSRVLVRG